jgi:(R,R)-butanediol dehydrogenase/meso-butanediol dehydrogenase/diacetyl reductase
VRLDDVGVPAEPGPGQVLLAPTLCGICGSDVHEYVAGPRYTLLDGAPVGGPQILGHEFAAEVVAVGRCAEGVSAGDRVSVMPLVPCGVCPACRAGRRDQCPRRGCVGLRHAWGGLGRLALVDASQVFALPDEVSWEQGALIEPAAVAMKAVRLGKVSVGDRVLIVGGGPIGALGAVIAESTGAASVVVVEPNPARGARLRGLGYDVVDPNSVDVVQFCRDATAGEGMDVAVDCSGSSAVGHMLLAALRIGGRAVVVGLKQSDVVVDFTALTRRSLSLVGSSGYPLQCWPELIRSAASGRLPIERVGDTPIPLADTSRALEDLGSPTTQRLKALIDVRR